VTRKGDCLIFTTSKTAMKNETCFVCGAAFVCGATSASGKCWCAELPLIVPYTDSSTCLCPDCLKAKIASMLADNPSSKPEKDTAMEGQ